MGTKDKIEELHRRRDESLHAGSERAVQRQHDKGKLTARERLDMLLDKGSFNEVDALVRHRAIGFGVEHERPPGDAVVTGWGTIDGRTVFIAAEDFTVFGGSLGEAVSQKVCKIMDLAAEVGAPVIGLKDGGGARIQEGVGSLDGYGKIFRRNVRCSGVIPQISAIMGPCAGGGVYSPALTDFTFQVQGTAHLFITGPDVIKAVTGEDVSFEELGGALVHGKRSGVVHFVEPDERHCMEDIRYLLGFLPSNNMEQPPYFAPTDSPDRVEPTLNSLIPDSPNQPYSIVDIITAVVDDGEFLSVHEHYAGNIVVGFARLNGHAVGVVGNQPAVLAGTLDIDASVKAARFVRTCDAFNIPIITFEDVPGFLPGTDQEYEGIIRHGAKLLYAYCEASVPRITVITRKAFGGAYVVMNSKAIGADVVFSWPSGDIAVMGASGAVNVIHRREIAAAEDANAARASLIADYEERFANPYLAAELGYVDEVIEPQDTRPRLIRALEMLLPKRETLPARKHGNIPL